MREAGGVGGHSESCVPPTAGAPRAADANSPAAAHRRSPQRPIRDLYAGAPGPDSFHMPHRANFDMSGPTSRSRTWRRADWATLIGVDCIVNTALLVAALIALLLLVYLVIALLRPEWF